MANIPIKVLLDKDRSPFIPFSTTSSIVENGTNRRLDKILGSLDDLQTNNKNSLVSAINEVLVGSGSGAGINIQIVDELPTENISLTTIYFKHMATGKPHNVYEEWMYINDAWELIGTTEMDLSGYATTAMVGDLSTLKTTDKDSVVDAVNELVDKQLVAGENITIDGNVINANTAEHIYEINPNFFYDVQNVDKTIISALITKMFTDGAKDPILRVRPTLNSNTTDISYYDFKLASNCYPFKKTDRYYFITNPIFNINGAPVSNQNTSLNCGYIYINGTWTGNVYTCSTAYYNSIFNEKLANIALLTNVLSKTNTSNYTPTKDYHPATKKYVDDKVAEGSGSGVDLSNYLAKDNTIEFTPTADYNPSTKKYVDDKFSSVPTIDSYTKTEIDTKLANYLAKDNLTEYTPTSDYHPATKKFVETVVASIDTSGFITDSNISEHLANYITETDLNEKLIKVPYIMVPRVTISSNSSGSDYWGDNTLNCSINNNTDWLAAIQKIAQSVLSKNWPKVYLPVTVLPFVDDFNETQANKMLRRHFLMELKPSNFGYFADEVSHTYTTGDEISTYFNGCIDLGIYGTLTVTFGITYQYNGESWTYNSYSNPNADVYIGRVTPVSSLNLTFDNKQIIHSYTESYKHKCVFSYRVSGCKNLSVNATTKIADLAGTSTLPDTLSTKCELFGTTVSNDVTTYTPLGEVTVFVYNNEMYMKVPDITTTNYTDVVCTISMTYEA